MVKIEGAGALLAALVEAESVTYDAAYADALADFTEERAERDAMVRGGLDGVLTLLDDSNLTLQSVRAATAATREAISLLDGSAK